MKLLVLGGTVYLGRAIVDCALARGHCITLFHRGQSNPGLFPDAEHILGDREHDLDRLAGRTFDACVDTCGYVPRIVGASARALVDAVDRYAFVSTLSVYGDPSPDGTAEDGSLATIDDPTVEEITGETYGPLKALCETRVRDAFGDRALLLRPGLIVGPHDPTDRFTYWPYRVARGGEILAPGRPGRGIQLIDVRDLAAWIVALLEQRESGAYNAVSPPEGLSMERMLGACLEVAGAEGTFTWVDDGFLVEHGVGAWIELPLWIPEEEPIARGFFDFLPDRAVSAGLTFRPIEETVRATLEWARTRPDDHEWRGGLTPEREAELLGSWHDRG
jgi:2'-hydroxyisoflavone reductase